MFLIYTYFNRNGRLRQKLDTDYEHDEKARVSFTDYFDLRLGDDERMGNGSDEHCAFVLLAEFDIDRGAQLTYQFPQPLGTDEGCVLPLINTYQMLIGVPGLHFSP